MKKNIIMQSKSYLLKIPRVLSNPKNWLAKLAGVLTRYKALLCNAIGSETPVSQGWEKAAVL